MRLQQGLEGHAVVIQKGQVGIVTSQDGNPIASGRLLAASVPDHHNFEDGEKFLANGGQISASHPEPWANPGAPLKILKWLGRADAPLAAMMDLTMAGQR